MAWHIEGLLDRLLYLTTGRAWTMSPEQRKGWDAVLPEAHWTVRMAGPRWFTIWEGDRQRLRRLHVLLLPVDWLGLTAAQEMALALEQLRPAEVPAQFASPLREARAKLRHALSRRP